MPKGEYLQYGGQAVIEGVMMRSPKHWAVACRAPNGKIVLHTEPMEKTWIGKQRWLKAPFLRGSLGILDALFLGNRALRISSEIQMDPRYLAEEGAEVEKSSEVIEYVERLPNTEKVDPENSSSEHEPLVQPSETTVPKKDEISPQKMRNAIIATMIVGLALGVLLFSALPNYIAELSVKIGVQSPTLKNFIAECVKIVIFLAYIGLIGLMKDIREIYKYHGAEHKAINALENDEPLTLDHCKRQTRLHPRCGTSFAIIVIILSLAFFTFVPRYPLGESAFLGFNVAVRVLVELALIPFVAGTAYELLRIAGKFRDQRWVNIAFAPGLGTQYLTTREPEDDQIEVALVSLRAVIDRDRDEPEVPEEEPEAAEIA